MATYALVKKGTVINTIVWDGPDASPMDFGKGVTFAGVPDGDGNNPSIGWSYDGAVFTSPPASDEENAANEQEAISANIALKQVLMEEATGKIGVLQDAVDLDMATDEEAAALPLWKKYRVLLNRVDANTSTELQLPEKPN